MARWILYCIIGYSRTVTVFVELFTKRIGLFGGLLWSFCIFYFLVSGRSSVSGDYLDTYLS